MIALRSPKYVKHILRETISLDSVAFLYRNGSEEPLYCISDRHSPFVEGEDPQAVISLIREGERDFQLRLAVRGEYHVEKPRYFVRDPNEWKEWLWICIPRSELLKIAGFLVKVFRRGLRA
ncbi:MAG: hypothetical protein DRN90_05300 [Thermoproteota archaeon]|nr:MAG: hypothetical protein DRN90_05300 [Candidatus Korarchaeota archaeon]